MSIPLQIAFLHVGSESLLPTLLVRSLRSHNLNSVVIQCTDMHTPVIQGVDHVFRTPGDTRNLMTFRLQCFANLGLTAPTLYLDTDMLCVRNLPKSDFIESADIAVCKREFGCQDYINTTFKGMDLSEYSRLTFGEVYPYVACATITRSCDFWKDCLQKLHQLHPKFHYWYGDQEAIRNVVNSGRYSIKFIEESSFGCLPDKLNSTAFTPYLYHFKGFKRKAMMIEYAKNLGLL